MTFRLALLAASMLASGGVAIADRNTAVDGNNGTLPLPTGQYVTPLAIPGVVQLMLNPGLPDYPDFVAGEAVKAQLSPDGNTLAILTAGENSLNTASGALDVPNSTQYLFLYDVSLAHRSAPVLKQVIRQPNAHVGLIWAGDGTLYAAGGADDAVYVYTPRADGTWVQSNRIDLNHPVMQGGTPPLPAQGSFGLPRHQGVGFNNGPFTIQSNASGLALSQDGRTLVVANNYNDSVSVIDTATRTVRYEHDLRPYFAGNEGKDGVAGGENPLGVAVKGNTTLYVGANRDREVVVVDISSPASGHLITRIPLDGNPNGMVLDAAQSRLFVAQDNADEVAVIDTATNTVVRQIDVRAPAGTLTDPSPTTRYTGVAPFAVALSPDGGTLFAVNDGANSLAVIPLTGTDAGTVVGLVPTAYAPKDVALSPDGATIYIINGKNDTGANPGFRTTATGALTQTTYPGGNAAAAAQANATNQYQFQLERSSLVAAPVASVVAHLDSLTAQVARNNFYSTAGLSPDDQATMDFLRRHIRHVIYIVKENRTYDQVLGDLGNGANGESSLTIFGEQITPNFHRIARGFVTLDNFMDAADGSMDGWSLATQGRVTTTEELNQQINYAFVNRGLSYDTEGSNRNIPIGLPALADRAAALQLSESQYRSNLAPLPGGAVNALPGIANDTATDAPFGIQQGYIYNAVLQAGLSVRNYGFLVSNFDGPAITGTKATPVTDPFAAGIPQCAALAPSLLTLTDLYFRGYDQAYPDLWRFYEWQREFNLYVAGNSLPSFETVRFSHDHMGSFAAALAGLGTPEAQQADDDYTVGRLVQAVAESPFASSTVIIVTEDDTQDGPDHVDSHRATTYLAGAYVKQGQIVSTRYNQVSVLRTIEDLLGAPHINLNTAYQRPMVEVFDTTLDPNWSYQAVASTILRDTTVIIGSREGAGTVTFAQGPPVVPTHDSAYWEKMTRGFDFSDADRVPNDLFNLVTWEGMTNGKPYPTAITNR